MEPASLLLTGVFFLEVLVHVSPASCPGYPRLFLPFFTSDTSSVSCWRHYKVKFYNMPNVLFHQQYRVRQTVRLRKELPGTPSYTQAGIFLVPPVAEAYDIGSNIAPDVIGCDPARLIRVRTSQTSVRQKIIRFLQLILRLRGGRDARSGLCGPKARVYERIQPNSLVYTV